MNNYTCECKNILYLGVYFYEIRVVDSTPALFLEMVKGETRSG
jgi:hypothetical protein